MLIPWTLALDSDLSVVDEKRGGANREMRVGAIGSPSSKIDAIDCFGMGHCLLSRVLSRLQ